jgi:hypothetical protein
MCGGPRIPGGLGGEAARTALTEQKRWLGAARLASVSTVLRGAFAAVATLVALAIHPASIVAKAIAFAIAVVPLVLAVVSRARATAARERAARASDEAWHAAAEDAAARRPGGIRASELATALGIEVDHADRLLTQLAAHDRTRVDIGDDAEIRYSTAPPELEASAEPDESELLRPRAAREPST